MISEKPCPGCNNRFLRRKKKQVYCSHFCHNAWRRSRTPEGDRTCLNCGEILTPYITPSGYEKSAKAFLKRKYCSHKCYSMAAVGKVRIRVDAGRRICVVCKREFERAYPEKVARFNLRKTCGSVMCVREIRSQAVKEARKVRDKNVYDRKSSKG